MSTKTFSELRADAARYRLAEWGDEHEQAAADLVSRDIPSYEQFWQAFVLPFRGPSGVWLRDDLAPSHEALCIHNYSAFRGITRAYELLEAARVSKASGEVGSDLFYDYCLWLVVVTDRIEQLAGSCYFYLFASADTTKRALKNWDKHASKLAGPLGIDLVAMLNGSSGRLKLYRNNIAHGVKFPGGRDRVPRESDLDLLYWSDFAKLAMTDEKEWLARTVDRLDLMEQLWNDVVPPVEMFWKELLARATSQFGSGQLPDHSKAALNPNTVAVTSTGGITTLRPANSDMFKGPSSGSTYPPSLQ